MKSQAFNPFLPSWEYIPDGEPHLFGGRVWLYGSHDKFGGKTWCENDYVAWSAPENDLSDWRFEGVIYRKEQDPENPKGTRCMYAPDVAEKRGRYFLYYTLDHMIGTVSVAVADTPNGPFRYYGKVRYPSGRIAGGDPGDLYNFDPSVFIDTDGKAYLYSGFCTRPVEQKMYDERGMRYGLYCYPLREDMLTIAGEPSLLIPMGAALESSSFCGHGFHEGSSMRKFGNTYYLIWSSQNRNELCYATSFRPDGGFEYRGVLVSNGDVGIGGITEETCRNFMGNNHGSLIEVGGKRYIFYHRQTNRHSFSRQACAEEIFVAKDGSMRQAEMTSCGLNGGPLAGKGEYPARIACNLWRGKGGKYYDADVDLEGEPYFTQSGEDREGEADQYIANMRSGATAGYKYFDLRATNGISITVRGRAEGVVDVLTEDGGSPVCTISLSLQGEEKTLGTPMHTGSGKDALYLRFRGEGSIDLLAFSLY